MYKYLISNKILQTTICVLLTVGFSISLQSQDTDTLMIANDQFTPSAATQPRELSSSDIGQINFLSVGNELYLKSGDISGQYAVKINGSETILDFTDGKSFYNEFESNDFGKLYFLQYKNIDGAQHSLSHIAQKHNFIRIKNIPLWLSLLPPVIAILLALIFKEVLISLFIGIWTGAFIAGGLRLDGVYYFIYSFFSTLHKYILEALTDADHLSIIVFSMLIGGMVAIISKNGGMAGVVKSLSRYANGPVSAQIVTWLLGIAIFFDDYANTLIVGNTMRPVTDKFKISREKLAYIVDSTAAPVAAIAFITTWIGAELGYIDDGMSTLGIENPMTAYSIFISSLKYSFYPILTLIFVFMVIKMGKDFGPMYKAENRAKRTGQVSSARNEEEDEPDMEDLSPVSGAPLKWHHAVIPVGGVILMTLFGLVDTGMESIYQTLMANEISLTDASWSQIWSNMDSIMNEGETGFISKLGSLIGSSNSYHALLWASLTGVILAVIITVWNKTMSLFDTMHWMVTGFKTMLPALLILTLAWSLAITTKELHTADFLSSTLGDAVNPYLFPMIIFVLAAFIAFSTGSSWSTMAILYPIAIPTMYAICQSNAMPMDITYELLFNVIATVLAASVLGDHCSPISDTTILSSLATDCNHIDHVRTQMPYALTVGIASISCVGLSTFLGGGLLISAILILISVGIFYLILNFFGKKINS